MKINYSIIIFVVLLFLFFLYLFLKVVLTNKNKLTEFRIIKEPITKSHAQSIKHDLCKECKKENKCYDFTKGMCIECHENNSCYNLFL